MSSHHTPALPTHAHAHACPCPTHTPLVLLLLLLPVCWQTYSTLGEKIFSRMGLSLMFLLPPDTRSVSLAISARILKQQH